MHHTIPLALVPVAMASRSVILEAPDNTCGYLNGMEKAPFGCLDTSAKCAIYYPTSSMAATASIDATMMPMITPAPQPSVVCCEPSRGDCTVQPTACVDAFADCTGICSNDPMTLKCTAEARLHCNRAHFESPLSFRNIKAVDAGLRPADAPADGWFCGESAIPVQQVDVSHSQTVSMTRVSQSSVSPTTTLGVTITLSRPGLGPGPSVSPSTTLSVTITLSKPGQKPGLQPVPPPPAARVSEEFDCEDDTPSRDDCCYDERDTAEPYYKEARRVRLRRRQAIGSSATADSPVAAPGHETSRGSAIVSTAYIGQTNRPPLVEATRPWNIVIPTPVATSTTTTTGPPRRPSPRKVKKNQLNIRAIAIGAILGGLGMIAIVCFAYGKWGHRLFSRQQQHSAQHQNGHGSAGHPVHVLKRPGKYLQHIKNLGSMACHAADLGFPHMPPDFGDTRAQPGPAFVGQPDSSFGGQPAPAFEGQPGLAFGGQPGPAFGRHQHGSPESGEATDVEDDFEPQSEESLERESCGKVMGIAGSGRRDRAYNVF